MSVVEFGAYLRRWRLEHHLRQQDIADRAQLDRTYVSRLENGDRKYKSIGEDILRRLAASVDADVDTLRALFYDQPLPRPLRLEPEPAREIPVYAQGSARDRDERYGGHRIDQHVGFIYEPRSRTLPAQLRGIEVRGNCMAPLIQPGDTLLIDETHDPRDGQVVVAEMLADGDVLIKRFFRQDGRIRLQPDDTSVADPVVVDAAEVRIEGVVVELRRRVA